MFFLAHPGGPIWAKRNQGAWSIPKGEPIGDEPLIEAAKREFAEENGQKLPDGDLIALGEAKQSSAKLVHAWALQGYIDAKLVKSNTFKMEWPPKSGNIQEFPENDRAAWFKLSEAKLKLFKYQVVFLERLADILKISEAAEPEIAEPRQQSLL